MKHFIQWLFCALLFASSAPAVPPPAPRLISPGTAAAPGPNLTTANPEFSFFQVLAAATYELTLKDPVTENTLAGPFTITPSGNSNEYWQGIPSGTFRASRTYLWEVTSVNSFGESSTTPSRFFFKTSSSFDATLPTVTITTPSSNISTEAKTFRLSGTASDAGGLTRVYAKIQGKTSEYTVDSMTNWNVTVPIALGTNVVFIYAIDNNGNVGSASRTITGTDTTLPTLSVNNITGDSLVTTTSPYQLTGTAEDNRSVNLVQYRINGGNWTNATGTATWSANLTLASGSQTVEVRARDTSSQYSVIKLIRLSYRLAEPQLTRFELPVTLDSPLKLFSTGTTNMSCLVESSTDLVTWAPTTIEFTQGATETATTVPVTLLEGPVHYFRIREK